MYTNAIIQETIINVTITTLTFIAENNGKQFSIMLSHLL